MIELGNDVGDVAARPSNSDDVALEAVTMVAMGVESARSGLVLPRVRPLRHSFVPIRRSMIGTSRARGEFAHALSLLVATLAEARAASADPTDEARLRGLVQRAKRELNVVDEKLLMFDRRRHRSIFRRADRLREHLDQLHYRLACYYVERTFDEESVPCQTDPPSSGS